jgi:hypothetical protein
MTLSLKDIEKVMKLMVKLQIATFECEGIKITKTLHLNPKPAKVLTATFSTVPVNFSSPDDVMFLSTKAPKMSLDEIDRWHAPVNKQAD